MYFIDKIRIIKTDQRIRKRKSIIPKQCSREQKHNYNG
jgi:hypothetical protein